MKKITIEKLKDLREALIASRMAHIKKEFNLVLRKKYKSGMLFEADVLENFITIAEREAEDENLRSSDKNTD